MENQNSNKAVNDNEILLGLKNEQFQPFFQPKVQSSTKKIVGSEALIRWVHPELGVLLPDTFLARLRANNLMPEICNIVINESLKMLQSHQSENFSVPISINIDTDSLLSPSFATTLKKKCETMGVDPSLIFFEISETYDIRNDNLQNSILSLDKQGFKISIDDFGTKFSTIKRLIELPAHEVKFDRFFLNEAQKSYKGYYLFTELLKIIKEINCAVVIEGVETEAQVNCVSKYKFCQLQGFYFSPGVPRKKFDELLKVQPFSL
ncbi:MAG: hypothetical protein CMK52_05620 [Proteobacteria bacterium]|nr:hypothetical protein [Pseudomonadota bacterium]|tara:strand:- start:2170 stop:2961 length:792 start_codon:yes stop_codon:yes gene_type:complete